MSNVNSILIIGLGMIGSSIALSSKSKGLKVSGFDLDASINDIALKDNIIDNSAESLEEINSLEYIKDIDLVVIAVPPKHTLDVILNLDQIWNTKTTITDTSSVKNHIKLDDKVSNIVLSHPIAGSDKSGLNAADKNLFTNRKSVICNPFEADKDHIDRVETFWRDALQMRTSIMSVSEHDLIFAMTSHLPHLISYALIDSIRLSPTQVGDNAGGGLKEFLRLSGSNSEMWRDVFILNRVDLIKALAGMQVSLNNLLELITESKEIPDVFSHLEMLKDELDEIKSFKEDKF
jgi:prephenate dehydrogenase|tara:strand:- start:42 stop:914 length:873 start_codon:yes stop_codon:yes gene_type:complete